MVGFSSASFPVRKQEAVTQEGTRGIDHPTWRRTQGASIVKGWEAKQRQGKTSEKREEKERDRGTEGEPNQLIQGN